MPIDDWEFKKGVFEMKVTDYYETYWSACGFHPRATLPMQLARLLDTTIRPGWRCLDVGCGDGRMSGTWLKAHGCEYVGVDISENAVGEARSLGLDAKRIEDAAALPFPGDSFDAVVCIEVLEHLFQPQLVVGETFRVLKPKGVLIATVPNVAYWRRRIDLALLGRWHPGGDNLAVEQPWRDPHIRFFNPGALRRMLIRAGFNSVQVGGHEGSLIGDIPWIGSRLRGARSSYAYQLLERFIPSLLGLRLHAIAHKSN